MKRLLPHLFLLFAPLGLQGQENVVLYRQGQSPLPVYVADSAPEPIHRLADELTSYLTRLSGASFKRVSERPDHGILLILEDNERHWLPAPSEPASPAERERYRLVSEEGSVILAGRSPLALTHAVFHLLRKFGYRQFFPGETWEIVPRREGLQISVDETTIPYYYVRDVFMAIRRSPRELIEATELPRRDAEFYDWQRKNRGLSAFELHSGHAYQAIVKRHQAEFKAHPEWLTSKATWADHGSGQYQPKFNVQHDDLRALIRRDALNWLKEHPTADTYSVDPSDGRGWPKESPIGSPSDQAIYLANDVVKAIRDEMPDKRVALYAYNVHAPPPNLRVEPGVIVSIATFFNRGIPVKQLMQSWRKKGVEELGIRDYISVWHGSYDLPGGRYLSGNPRAFLNSLREYARDGARYYRAETTSGGWAIYGLSLYGAMQTLWNPDDTDATALLDDFVTSAFGEAAPVMRQFFTLIDSASYPIVSDVLTGQMYQLLHQALQRVHGTPDEKAITRRLLELVAYTRYVELASGMIRSEGSEKITSYRNLARFAIGYRRSPVVPVAHLFGRAAPFLPLWEKLQPIGAAIMGESLPPAPASDTLALLNERLAAVKPLGFVPVAYQGPLQPSPDRSAPPAANYTFSLRQTLHWLAKEGESLTLTVLSRETLDAKQPITLSLTFTEDPDLIASQTVSVPADNQRHTVSFEANDAGLYQIDLSDPAGTSEIAWPEGTPLSLPAGQQGMSHPAGTYNGWFYLPAGVTDIGGYSQTPAGRITDAEGNTLFRFDTLTEGSYFYLPVPAAPHGRFLRLEGVMGRKQFLTVPPYLARRPSELLIPTSALPSP